MIDHPSRTHVRDHSRVDASTFVDAPMLPWHQTLALHFGPGILFFASFLALAPVAEAAGFPRELGFTLAGLLVVTPFQLWFLRRQALQTTGRPSVMGAVAYRQPLSAARTTTVVVALTAFAAVVYFGGAGFVDWTQGALFGWMPDSLRVGSEDLDDFSTSVAVTAVLLNLVGDGVISPIAEELYFRGNLMARLPVRRLLLPVTSAALFSCSHLWEPELWLTVFVVQVANCWAVLRFGNVRTAVLFHVIANSIVTLITLYGVLA